jgi:hypothetical protein
MIGAADELRPRGLEALARRYLDVAARIRRRTGKDVGAGSDALEVEIIRAGTEPIAAAVSDELQRLRLGQGQGAEHDRVEQAEDRRVRANPQGEGQDHDHGKAWCAGECAEGVAQILAQLVEPAPPPHRARILHGQHHVAEPDQGPAASFVGWQAEGDVVGRLPLDMIAEVGVEILQRTFSVRHGPAPPYS